MVNQAGLELVRIKPTPDVARDAADGLSPVNATLEARGGRGDLQDRSEHVCHPDDQVTRCRRGLGVVCCDDQNHAPHIIAAGNGAGHASSADPSGNRTIAIIGHGFGDGAWTPERIAKDPGSIVDVGSRNARGTRQTHWLEPMAIATPHGDMPEAEAFPD